MKYYQVIFIDEYDNLFEIGYFKSLEDAEPEVNEMLSQYVLGEDNDVDPGATPEFGPNKNLDRLVEYASTFNTCFDRMISVEEGYVQVRGFVKDTEDTINELKKLAGKNNG